MSHTLVLNADGQPLKWLPLSTKHWHDAIKHYFEDRVSILQHYDDWVVHSPSVEMNVPAIIMTRQYIHRNHYVVFSRQNVFLRDNFRCQYCEAVYAMGELTLDHVLPRYHGGKTTWTNCVAACRICNTRKGHYLKMKPVRAPYRPSYGEMVEKRHALPIVISHQSWRDYINWPAELVILRTPRKSFV